MMSKMRRERSSQQPQSTTDTPLLPTQPNHPDSRCSPSRTLPDLLLHLPSTNHIKNYQQTIPSLIPIHHLILSAAQSPLGASTRSIVSTPPNPLLLHVHSGSQGHIPLHQHLPPTHLLYPAATVPLLHCLHLPAHLPNQPTLLPPPPSFPFPKT